MQAGAYQGMKNIGSSVTLKLMTFNVWVGGDQVSFSKVIEAITASGADIVCLQEPQGATAEIATAAGFPYASIDHHVISRFPLYAPPTERQPSGLRLNYLYAELAPGEFVAVFNWHLPSGPEYVSYALRDGQSVEQVLRSAKTSRLPSIEPYLPIIKNTADAGTPVVVAGDFNGPSHLDWTEATIDSRPYQRAAVDWPVTKRLSDMGFVDTYRAIHPDPKARRGATWTLGYPYPHRDAREVEDRIDYVQALGPVRVLDAELMGDPGMPDNDIAVSPWPSDHRAVVATLEAEGGPAPAMISVARPVLRRGESIDLRYHAATEDGRLEDGRVVVLPMGAAADAAAILSMNTNIGSDRMRGVDLGSSALQPGAYVAALRDVSGEELARAPFWILAADARPELSTDNARYRSGEPIRVRWSNAPGHAFDMIALYAQGESNPINYRVQLFTDAASSGSLVFDEAVTGAKLAPGSYDLRLMLDDGYEELGRVSFTVMAP